jgi:hypothetical protein
LHVGSICGASEGARRHRAWMRLFTRWRDRVLLACRLRFLRDGLEPREAPHPRRRLPSARARRPRVSAPAATSRPCRRGGDRRLGTYRVRPTHPIRPPLPRRSEQENSRCLVGRRSYSSVCLHYGRGRWWPAGSARRRRASARSRRSGKTPSGARRPRSARSSRSKPAAYRWASFALA